MIFLDSFPSSMDDIGKHTISVFWVAVTLLVLFVVIFSILFILLKLYKYLKRKLSE